MNRSVYEATEETVSDEPLLSEVMKQFHKESSKLVTLALDKFQKDKKAKKAKKAKQAKKAKKKDEATNAMPQFGRSVTVNKQVATVVTNPYANAAGTPAHGGGQGRVPGAGVPAAFT